MIPTDEMLETLALAFRHVDFTQPKALVVYRELEKTLEPFMENPKVTTWREFRFYQLGRAVKIAENKYLRCPP
jgi:hypothetical protein